MTPDLLRRVGEALYGEAWKSQLALDLSVDRRTMRRWASGEHPIPPSVMVDIMGMVEAHREIIEELYRDLFAEFQGEGNGRQ